MVEDGVWKPYVPSKKAVAKAKVSKRRLRNKRRKSRIKLQASKARGNKPYHLYVLELEDGFYYVGMSRNVEKRFRSHSIGKGANWTKLHKPIRIIESRETKYTSMAPASKLEDQLTLEMAKKYGYHKVRGGGYCQQFPHWPK